MRNRVKEKFGTAAIGAAIATLALGAQGCGDDRTVVEISTGKAPALLAHRVQGGAWQVVPVQGQTEFELEVEGPYEVVIVCERDGRRRTLLADRYARTPADDKEILARCLNANLPYTVRGVVKQPGEVAFGTSAMGTTASEWSFELDSGAGTFELLLWKGDLNVGLESIAIRRDIRLTGDLDLGTIDLAQENMQPLVPVTFTAPNLRPEEVKLASLTLDTGGTNVPTYLHWDAEWNLLLAPESVLKAGDRQVVQLTATTQSEGSSLHHYRSATASARVGGATSAVLPEPLESAVLEKSSGRLTASWSTLPAHEEMTMFWDSFSDDYRRAWFHSAHISRAYLEATGATSEGLDFHDIPGFDLDWQQDPRREHFIGLGVSTGRYDEAGGASSGMDESFPSATPPQEVQAMARKRAAWLPLRRELPLEGAPQRPYLLRAR